MKSTDRFYSRSWNPLEDPTLPLREPDAGLWLVDPDLFGSEIVPLGGVLNGEAIDRAYAVMGLCGPDGPHGPATFILPTAYPDRMAAYWSEGGPITAIIAAASEIHGEPCRGGTVYESLGHVIPAVTLATQADADRLVPALLSVPAVRRAVVLRPTEPIDVGRHLVPRLIPARLAAAMDSATGVVHRVIGPTGLGWVILESVPPADDWAAYYPGLVRRWCRDAEVPLWSAVPIDGEIVRQWPVGIGVPGKEQ